MTTKIGTQGYGSGIVLPEHVMALCPTLWSPVCQQAMELAAANLAGTVNKGTIDNIQNVLQSSTGSAALPEKFELDLADYNDPANDQQTLIGEKHPRNVLDPVGASMCVNNQSCVYKFRNNGGSSAVVDFHIFKVHGLDAGSSSMPLSYDQTRPNADVSSFYPGFNGSIPYQTPSSFIAGKPNGFIASPVANPALTNLMARKSWLDSWLCAKAAKIHGTNPTTTSGDSTGSLVPFSSDPVFLLPTEHIAGASGSAPFHRTLNENNSRQLALNCWWPLANARLNFHPSVNGVRYNDNMRCVGTKTFTLKQGQAGVYDVQMGGFTYKFSDIAQFFGGPSEYFVSGLFICSSPMRS